MKILFICTGNYYRSRFAELLFNFLSQKKSLKAVAFSRGLAIDHPDNVGWISSHVITYLEYLKMQKIEFAPPQKVNEQDFENADKIILLSEKEHRPMIRELFPAWEEKANYWTFEDEDVVPPHQMLPQLEKKINEFINSLSC